MQIISVKQAAAARLRKSRKIPMNSIGNNFFAAERLNSKTQLDFEKTFMYKQ